MNQAAMQQAIVDQHRARLAGFAAQPLPAGQSQGAVYRAALAACSALGFIAADALVLARAWQAQTDRLGQFDAAHWPDAPQDFGLQAQPRADAFAPCPKALGLYAVVPDAAWVARMAAAGVPTVQLRFKHADDAVIQAEVRAAVAAVAGSPTRLFINDHWQAAIAAGAYGVHLGQEDLQSLQPAQLACLRASGLRLGVSTHGYAEMLAADRLAPSYIALGAVFPTTLKSMPTAPQGLARLADYARLMRVYPLVAIGGIGAAQVPAVRACGVGSVAVVRAIVQAADPRAAAQQLMALMQATTER
ncbi:thiamine phosphate synthase [Comamonas sp. NLF-1-9]|uniref:thiamine phosphate synthase n=1 Tax=Comamonas sp. NLF-1-9 TaxID=2853163 RepID=UPI001C4396C0|nr:thiamine phosphate synthase [Comamonas sp. NLF-1-9]QXL85521.1 thiamine phosphate synthase [Comamonas sp. NLF-1-9]